MKLHSLLASLVLGGLALVPLTGPALATGAYASNKISVFEQPRSRSNEIVGLLWAGEPVTIDRCTASGRWCRVFHDGPTGWVPASYLIGAAAKTEATPLPSLTDPPFDQQKDLDHTRRGFW